MIAAACAGPVLVINRITLAEPLLSAFSGSGHPLPRRPERRLGLVDRLSATPPICAVRRHATLGGFSFCHSSTPSPPTRAPMVKHGEDFAVHDARDGAISK